MAGESDTEMKTNPENNVDIDKYRNLVRTYIDMHLYSAALFWADKVVSLSDGEPRDVYWLAQCMFLMKQYHRAAILIRNRGLDKIHPLCLYLASKCLLEAREFNEALQLLSDIDDQAGTLLNSSSSNITFTVNNSHLFVEGSTPANLKSSLLYLKGRVYEALDNRSLAADCYKHALQCDVYNFDAFEALVQHQMLTAWEEKQLLSSLPFAEQCGNENFVRPVYETLLKKYHASPRSPSPPIPHSRLADNLDLAVAKAERLYYSCAYKECFNITEEVLKKDPYHTTCLPVHIGCLVELKKTNKLFYLAHDLVDLQPEMAISWFAVGCYYYLIGKSDPARRYLGKATSLDRLFGPAWLAYGHSFAVENEHDQAMAAYFKASQLMKGCHLPLLYIGLECGLTNNVKLADKFFVQAQTIAPQDPFVIHEMGVVAFQNQEYSLAEQHFIDAMAKVRLINETIIADKWEPLLNNLGHVCRKLKKYEEALQFHQQALLLSPLNASTLACIGFVQALLGEVAASVETFHKALGLKRDDSFSTTMLTYVIEHLMEEAPPFVGAPDTVPGLESSTLKYLPRSTDTEEDADKYLSKSDDTEEDIETSEVETQFGGDMIAGTPSSSSHNLSCEIEMQDVYQDENTS